MSSGMFWVSSLFVTLMLILMPTMIVCAKIKKFIPSNADDKSTIQVPLDSNSSAHMFLFYPFGNENLNARDYDYVEGRVYWSDNTQGRILSSFFNATSQKILFHCNVKKPEGLAIDYVGRNIYWTDAGTNRIEVGLLDGTGRKLLIKDGLVKPKAIVLHIKKGMMYWTEWGASPKIKRAGMDGSARQTVVEKNLGWPNELTIDLATDRLYWVDAKLNNMERSDLNGGNRESLVLSTAYINPYRPAVLENALYWTDWTTKSISRLNLSSGNQRIIVDGLQKPMDIHVFDSALIFSGSHPCTQNNGPCSDLCLLKPGGNGAYQCACPTGIQLKADGKSCDFGLFYKAILDQFMIFAEDKGEIYKVPLGVPETPCYPLGINTNISSPAAVDYDPVEGKIYWTDLSLKLLARAHPNGSSVEVIVKSNVTIPGGLAVDPVARNIYWTDEGKNGIEVAKLDGSSRRSLIRSNKPSAILLDIEERKMYWGADKEASVKIEQANLDGSGRKALVIDGVMQVNSLAMDFKNRLLYWCDALLHKIERVDLQGNNRKLILDLSSDCMQPFGLALFGDVLYWSDWKSKSIHKYNMTTSVQGVVVSGVGKPMKLHIYDRSKDVVGRLCPVLQPPINGSITSLSCGFSFGSEASLACNTGYRMAGSPLRSCREDGTWSGREATCNKIYEEASEDKQSNPTLPATVTGSLILITLIILISIFAWKRYLLRITNVESMGQSNSAYVVDTQDEIEEVETSSSSNSWSPYLQIENEADQYSPTCSNETLSNRVPASFSNYITNIEATITNTGGELCAPLNSDVRIIVPSGAVPDGVNQPVFFRVFSDETTLLRDIPKAPDETLISPVVECGPHDIYLSKSVEIIVPHCLCLSEAKKELITVYRCGSFSAGVEGRLSWERVPNKSAKTSQSKYWFTVEKDSIRIKTKTFSLWSIFACGRPRRKRATVFASRPDPTSDLVYLRFYVYSDNEDSKRRVELSDRERFPESKPAKEKPFRMYQDNAVITVKLTGLEDGWKLHKSNDTQVYNCGRANGNGFRSQDSCDFALKPEDGRDVNGFSCTVEFQQEDGDDNHKYSIYVNPGFTPLMRIRQSTAGGGRGSDITSSGASACGIAESPSSKPPEEDDDDDQRSYSQKRKTFRDYSPGEGPADCSHFNEVVTQGLCLHISPYVGGNWKRVLRNLSMDDMIIRNLDEDFKNCRVADKCYEAFIAWKESVGSQRATIKNLCDALRRVGCSEALKCIEERQYVA